MADVFPIYKATSTGLKFKGTESRLLRTKKLISQDELESYRNRTIRSQEVLFGLQDYKKNSAHHLAVQREKVRRYDGALTGNCAFKRLLDRCATGQEVSTLIKEGFLMVGCGVQTFTLHDAMYLHQGARSEYFDIHDLHFTEDMYLRDEVDTGESFRVGGIILNIPNSTSNRIIKTTTTVGLYNINESMEEWANDLENTLKDAGRVQRPIPHHHLAQIFESKPEWVNDDTLLIGKAIREVGSLPYSTNHHIILISDDRRLANQMSQSVGCDVHRLRPRDVILMSRLKEWSVETKLPPKIIRNMYKAPYACSYPTELIYYDYGSIASAAAKLQLQRGKPFQRKINIFRKETIDYGINADGHRFSEFTLRKLEIPSTAHVEYHRLHVRRRTYASYGHMLSRGDSLDNREAIPSPPNTL
jgi:hypothetical protein